jgi:DNA polymerase-3 subunit delta
MGRLQGIQVSPGAASALIDLVGTNTIALDSELRKIALAHRGNDPVNENEVYALVSRTAEVKPWEFIDAFSSRNIDRCLSLLAKMGKTSPHALHAMCTTRVRDLLKTKALISRGEQASLAKALKLPEWKTRNFLSWARNYSNNELIAALASSMETEKAMKSGADPDDAFLDWVLGVMKRR